MEKGLYQNLRKFITVIDNLRDVGLQKHIKLPRIVTLGTQSSGKSSLLESIVGMDFLPRGEGVCTRRPLELRLVHVQESSSHSPPYGEFEAIPNKKFTNFDEIKKSIEMLTDKVAGIKKGIIDDPIVLTIHSEACPDLTLVDLPGITRIPLKDSDQPENIEEITMKMAHRYISDERTIILCVIAANQDLSTSDALKMARTIDPKGQRTIGVLTKIDIMDSGTSAKSILTNKDIPLKLGYVGVKNRNQQDIKDCKKVSLALQEEKLYFSKHPIYSTLPQGLLGTEVLTSKLSNQLFDHIRRHLPEIMKEMSIKLEECQERFRLLGPPLPQNDTEKTQLIWDMVTRFALQFRNSIEGKYSTDANLSLSQPEGAKIRIMFNDIFQDFLPDKFTASKEYTDKDISKAIKKHEGDSLPGFYGQDAFLYLLDPILDRLKEPSQDCVNEIFILLEKMSNELLQKECQRFPTLLGEMQERVVKILDTEREKTKQIVDDVIESEIGYLFTADQDFFKSFFETMDLAPKPNQRPVQAGQPIQPVQPEILTEEKVRSLIIKEMRNKIEIYFKIVVRNLRDRIPKTIGYFFIKRLQETIQLQLIGELNNDEELRESLKEQKDVKEERERLQSTIQVLKNSQKIIKRDPDLQAFIYAAKMNSEQSENSPKDESSAHHQHNSSGPQGPSVPQGQSVPQGKYMPGQVGQGQTGISQKDLPVHQKQASNPNINNPNMQQNQQIPNQQALKQQQQQPQQPISQARVQPPQQQQQQQQIQQSNSGKNLNPSAQQTPSTTNASTPRTQFQQAAPQPPQPSQPNQYTQQQQQQQALQQQQQAQAQAVAAAAAAQQAKRPAIFQGTGASESKNPLGGATGANPPQAQAQQAAAQDPKKKDGQKQKPKGSNLFG